MEIATGEWEDEANKVTKHTCTHTQHITLPSFTPFFPFFFFSLRGQTFRVQISGKLNSLPTAFSGLKITPQ